MKKPSILFLFGIFMSLMACNEKYPDLKDGLYAEFTTNKGTFLAELYYEQTPITVANFVSLAEGTNTMVDSMYKGKHFYDSLIFHRVIKDFMIQGGDPLGTGTGGPGYKFPDEFVDSLKLDDKGILAMANSGPGTNGSQFFITLKETPWLNGRHTVFGKIVKGQGVVDSIGLVETVKPSNKPVEDVIIEKVNIIRRGNGAKDFNAAKVFTSEMEKMVQKEAEASKKMEAAKKEAAENFAKMKTKAEKLPSGLMVYFNKEAGGEKPNTGDKVTVYYEGYLPDGTLFDSNRQEIAEKYGMLNQQRLQAGGYTPMPMDYSPDARMIAGFKEGVQLMSVGDVATFFIPAHLGYGAQGAGNVIPPNAELIFKIELVEIQK